MRMADIVDMQTAGGESPGGQSPGTMAVLEALLRAKGLLPATPGVRRGGIPGGIPGVNGIMLPPVGVPWQSTPGGGARG